MYASVEVIINDDSLPSVISCVWDTREQAIASTVNKYCQHIHDFHPIERVTELVRSTGKIGFGNTSFHVVKI